MAGAKVPLTFRIFKGDQLLREERLSLCVIKLGKVPSAHLKLDDETVSRMHAIIEVNGPGDVSIIDLGSTKGTFVNGQKVNKAKLQSGDTIVVGETRIELAIGAGEEDDATADQRSRRPPSAMSSRRRRARLRRRCRRRRRPAAPRCARAAARSSRRRRRSRRRAAPRRLRPPRPHCRRPRPCIARRPASGWRADLRRRDGARRPASSPRWPSEADDFGGARAVEVAAMLGDSVVGVKHCIDPKGGKVSADDVGACSRSALRASVASSSRSAPRSRTPPSTRARSTTMDAQDRRSKPGLRRVPPAHAVGRLRLDRVRRPVRRRHPADVGARARSARRSRARTSASARAPGVEFPTEGAPAPDFPLVAPHGDDFAFHFGHGMEGEMVVNGQTTSLAELAAAGPHDDLADSRRARRSASAPARPRSSSPRCRSRAAT